MMGIVFYLVKAFLLFVKCVSYLVAFFFRFGKKKELPPIQDGILLKSANKLAEEIRKGKLKSVQVISAFIKRIEEVDPYINAVVQNRFKEALEEAKEVDALIESGKFTEEQLEKEKPLLGVPFTVKVVFSVKGLKQTAGSVLFKDLVSKKDAVVVTRLKNAGGIVLSTTNCAELGCFIETYNFVHGRTNNPYDTSRTPGGSSGGEAAIIAAAGSVIGIGNDLTGSVRIPTHFCCLFGHKPSKDFVPNDGCLPPPPPVGEYILTPGPICRYAEDLALTMRLLSPENKEILYAENTIDFRNLKIFYQTGLRSDPYVEYPDQEIVEAIHKAASHFTKTYGAIAKEVNIPSFKETIFIGNYLIREGNTGFFEHITLGKIKSGNPYLGIIKFFSGLSKWTLSELGPLFSQTMYFKEYTPYYKSLNTKLIETFEDLLDENSVFLFPTFPVAAPLHYASLSYFPSVAYMTVFNITGMPATQCPMGLNKNGLPIGIQIAGRRKNDRLTIACAIELEKAFGGWIRPDKINI